MAAVVLVGLWARELSGSLVATIPAAPIAGSSFTKERRLDEVEAFCFDSFLFASVLLFTIYLMWLI